jgi:TRAP-type C4-dicarboxylate transport system permease small subunit
MFALRLGGPRSVRQLGTGKPRLVRWLDALDSALMIACAAATLAAGLVLTYSVAIRYAFHWSTDWQDEIAVFLLVGATFLSAPYVQSVRGHIAIESLQSLFSPQLESIRLVLADILSAAFCSFFTWQSWGLLLEAIEEHQVTDSAWSPPLWIPYGLMTAGMTLLTCRLMLQLVQTLGHHSGVRP